MAERDEKGRFLQGNKCAEGHENPTRRRRLVFQDGFYWRVQPKDMDAITEKLVELAKGGNMLAIKEILDRMIGKPEPIVPEPESFRITVKFPPELEDM